MADDQPDDIAFTVRLVAELATGVLAPWPRVVWGGFEIGEDETHTFYVMEMIFDWRVCTSPKTAPLTYDTGFYYTGKSQATFWLACAAALLWIGEGGPEPRHWNKNVMTGEWREHGRAEQETGTRPDPG